MPRFDNTTVEGRKALVKHVLHENYLEGNEPDKHLNNLLDEFVQGKITANDVVKLTAEGSSKSKQ